MDSGQPIKIVTCNIRDARADDGANNWLLRRELCASVLHGLNADIICFQELRQQQRDFIAAELAAFEHYGLQESAAVSDAPNAIFWRRAAFDCIDSGGYWLSEQPQIVGSSAWGSEHIRLMNFVLLQQINGKHLRVMNTHLDNGRQRAREQQARLLARDDCAEQSRRGEMQILCGDMNCARGNPVIDIFSAAGWRDSYAALHADARDEFTYHAFEGPAYDPLQYPDEPQGRIDWIFARGAATIVGAEIIRAGAAGRFPSDHYPVSATLML